MKTLETTLIEQAKLTQIDVQKGKISPDQGKETLETIVDIIDKTSKEAISLVNLVGELLESINNLFSFRSAGIMGASEADEISLYHTPQTIPGLLEPLPDHIRCNGLVHGGILHLEKNSHLIMARRMIDIVHKMENGEQKYSLLKTYTQHLTISFKKGDEIDYHEVIPNQFYIKSKEGLVHISGIYIPKNEYFNSIDDLASLGTIQHSQAYALDDEICVPFYQQLIEDYGGNDYLISSLNILKNNSIPPSSTTCINSPLLRVDIIEGMDNSKYAHVIQNSAVLESEKIRFSEDHNKEKLLFDDTPRTLILK